MAKMTAPGGWEVEQVVLDRGKGAAQYLRVKQHGLLSLGGGYFQSPADVQRIMGADAFAALVVA